MITNSNKPMISVIVPVYNVAQFLERCVDSIIHQTYPNLEIILVDDGSTDDSGLLCDQLKAADNRIRVVHKVNGGLSSARNAGINAATGCYIGFVDSDDYIAPQMYEKMLGDLIINEADIAQCGCEIVWGDHVELRNGSGKVYIWNRDEAVINHLSGQITEPSVCCKLYKSEIFKTLRFDESIKLSEDIPFNVKAFMLCRKSVFRDECYYKYIKRDNSLSRSAFDEKEIDTVKQAEAIVETLKDEGRKVKEAAYAKLFGTIISVYNHSLFAEKDYKELRKDLKAREG